MTPMACSARRLAVFELVGIEWRLRLLLPCQTTGDTHPGAVQPLYAG